MLYTRQLHFSEGQLYLNLDGIGSWSAHTCRPSGKVAGGIYLVPKHPSKYFAEGEGSGDRPCFSSPILRVGNVNETFDHPPRLMPFPEESSHAAFADASAFEHCSKCAVDYVCACAN